MLSSMNDIPYHRYLSGTHFATASKTLLTILKTLADKRETRGWCSARPKSLLTNSDVTVKATHVLSRGACHKGCHLTIVFFPLIPPSNEWVITRHLHNYNQRQSSATDKPIRKKKMTGKKSRFLPRLPGGKHGEGLAVELPSSFAAQTLLGGWAALLCNRSGVAVHTGWYLIWPCQRVFTGALD